MRGLAARTRGSLSIGASPPSALSHEAVLHTERVGESCGSLMHVVTRAAPLTTCGEAVARCEPWRVARCALQPHLGSRASGLAHLATACHATTGIMAQAVTESRVLSVIGATTQEHAELGAAAQRHAAPSATICFGRSLDTHCPLSHVSGAPPQHVATSLAGAWGACGQLPCRPHSCLATALHGRQLRSGESLPGACRRDQRPGALLGRTAVSGRAHAARAGLPAASWGSEELAIRLRNAAETLAGRARPQPAAASPHQGAAAALPLHPLSC